MMTALPQRAVPRPEMQLLALGGLTTFVSLTTIIHVSGPVLAELPEMIIPLGVSAGLGLFSIRVFRREYESECTKKMVKYGWIGALTAVAVSGWWIVLHIHYGMVVGLPEQIATLMSGGIATGLIIGYSRYDKGVQPILIKQDRLVEEISWTSHSGSNPILTAIYDLLVELEGEDSTNRTPLYTHVDPDIFSALQKHDGDPWQVWFQTEQYVICVSGRGTVSAYSSTGEDALSKTISFDSDADYEPSFHP